MARNKVMTLWTTIVTAFLALCTALGLHHDDRLRGRTADRNAQQHRALPRGGTRRGGTLVLVTYRLPAPTMKQRIRAEAHGKAPTCRHRPTADATATSTDLLCDDTAEVPARHTTAQHNRAAATLGARARTAPAAAPAPPEPDVTAICVQHHTRKRPGRSTEQPGRRRVRGHRPNSSRPLQGG